MKVKETRLKWYKGKGSIWVIKRVVATDVHVPRMRRK